MSSKKCSSCFLEVNRIHNRLHGKGNTILQKAAGIVDH